MQPTLQFANSAVSMSPPPCKHFCVLQSLPPSGGSTLRTFFACIRVGLPAARVGTVEDEVAAYLHPAAVQQACGGHLIRFETVYLYSVDTLT